MSIDARYYTIEGWMRSQLGLKGAELNVFAIVYSMTINADNRSFYGNYSYFQEWIGCSEPTVIKALNNLVDKKLLNKEVVGVRGFVKKNAYTVNMEKISPIIPKAIYKNTNK